MAGVLTEAGPLLHMALSSQAGGQLGHRHLFGEQAPCVARDPSVGALAVMENIFHF